MKEAFSHLEYTAPSDQYFNYCWWPYEPVAAVEDKFRPVSLLFQSFQLAGMDARAFQIVNAIRDAIGPFRTVWGVKFVNGHLGWEFYFYDYKRRDRELSISRTLAAIGPWVKCEVPVNENLPYFMFSLDIDNQLVTGQRELEVVHMYIGNPGSTVSSGIAYALTVDGAALENFYFFFNAKEHLRQAAEKIYCSAHIDAARIGIDRILHPQLTDCHTICVANKGHSDTVYFSGVNVDQLLYFMEMLEYPEEITLFVQEHRGKLDHLLYDVGFDYAADGDHLQIVKSGYYGVF